jgi:hypothetical protein
MRAGFVDEGNLGAALAAQCVAEPCGQFESTGPSADDNNAVWPTHLVSMARPLPATCAVIISYSWEVLLRGIIELSRRPIGCQTQVEKCPHCIRPLRKRDGGKGIDRSLREGDMQE